METIFKKIGYAVSLKKEKQDDVAVTLLTINSPDGTPRWIWNANCKKPLFLKFYNVGSKRALLFATFIKLIFLTRHQKIIFKKKTYFVSKLESNIFDITKNWALFTGTVGPNNKAILYANDSFYKIATTANSQKLIAHEHHLLENLNAVSKSFIVPKSTKISNEIIQLSDISSGGKRLKNITLLNSKSLIEMNKIENKIIKVSEWELFSNLKNEFKSMNDSRIPKNFIRKINAVLETIADDDLVEISLSQGDYTQWNMFQAQEKLAIYDWELADINKPKAFDYFHFIIQNDVLVSHKPWKEIYSNIIHSSDNEFSKEMFNYDLDELNNYLKWYLLINCMHYLKIYANQTNWHIQVEWLFQVWTEAFNTILQEDYTARELIIMDLFDAIQNKEYAALKFQNGFPEQLNSDSDIDLVINKKQSKAVVKMLKKHALVSKIKTHKLSFMNTIQVITNDASILSIDLLWKIKYKNLEFLNSDKMIANGSQNIFGVKNASFDDTAHFIAMFYTLNGATIPEKYSEYKEALKNSNEIIDLKIANSINTNSNRKKLIEIIKKSSNNNGFGYLKNTLNYLIDTLKTFKKSNGFVVTFSGVDGAGKSTVIENIAKKIEKQFRKPVVVLRHRPSILPILSVWTKGQEKAYQDVISSLPRQGQNSNIVSSFIRFAYYYCDYFIGQFVVYFKHIVRGHVVIYDRYYFDFINDSKRSNIILPKNISRLGYNLLLKPKYNFFLFAETDIILNRKKELTKETIENLTDDYTKLFYSLQSRSNSNVYMPINNVDLDTTLKQIIKTVNFSLN